MELASHTKFVGKCDSGRDNMHSIKRPRNCEGPVVFLSRFLLIFKILLIFKPVLVYLLKGTEGQHWLGCLDPFLSLAL